MFTKHCVRCGRRPRTSETFLCQTCLTDPKARLEIDRALTRAERSHVDARRFVLERFHWAGGW